MRTVLLVWLLLASLGCAEALGQTDTFPKKLQLGCASLEDCERLEAEAAARVERCLPNTVGYIRCGDARGDHQIAQSYANSWRKKQKEREERVLREKEQADSDRAVEAEAQRVADAEKERVRAQAERVERAWREIEPEKCAVDGDEPTCRKLSRFTSLWGTNQHLDEATAAIEAGRVVIAERRKVEAEEAAAEEKKRPRPPAQPSGRVCCCDGTVSPSCTVVKRGCCSRHDGVCPCK